MKIKPFTSSTARTLLAIIGALVLIAIPLSPAYAAACTFTSITNGNWNVAGTWNAVGTACGTYPGASFADDTVIVAAGTAVSLNVTPPQSIGPLTVNGTLTAATNNTSLSVDSLTINSGGVLNQNRNLTVTGDTVVSGSANFASNSGNNRDMTFGGNVTLNSGASWVEAGIGNGSGNNYYFGGSFTNNATTFTAASTGVHDFTGTGAIGGATASQFNNVNVQATLTNNGTLTVTTALTVSGLAARTLVNASTGTLNYGGTGAIAPTLTATAAGNVVNYNRAGAQTVKATAYDHLILSGSGAKTVATGFTITNGNGNLSIAPTGTATLSMGNTSFSVTSLTLGGVAQASGTYGSSASGATNKLSTYFGATGTGVLTVGKAQQTIAFGALSPKNFGDADFTVSATASSTLPVTFSTTTTGVCSVSTNTVHLLATGTCTIDADQAGNGNYTAAPRVSQSFTVNKGDQTITFDPLADKTYGDADFTVSANASSGLTVSFTSGTIGICTVAGNTVHIVAAGDCTINADQAGNANYNAAPQAPQSFTVDPKAISVTADAKSKVYGAADPALTYSADALVGTDAFSGALARTAGEDVGEYGITQGTLALSSNYTLNFTGAKLTITAKPINVTAQPKTKVYGAADPALTYTHDALLGTDALTGTLTREAGENVGPYAILQGTLTAGTNYTINFTGDNLTITAKPIDVTADPQTKVYGDADPQLTYQSDALVTGDDSFTGALTRDPGEDVGTYDITQGTLTAGPNYTINFTGDDLVITAKAVSVTADAKTKTYGDTDPALTYTHSALAFSDTFSGALARDPGEDVATYAITQGTLALSSNYTLNFTGADLTITKKAIGVTAVAKSKVYGDADPALTYTNDTLAFSDTFSGALARDPGEDVGLYDITQGTLALSSNYTLNFTGAQLEITAKSIAVTADAKSKVYGDADPALTYSADALVGTDAFSGALTRAAGEDVGPYAITQGTLTAGTNYTINFTGANLTITKKVLTQATADDKTITVGDPDPLFTVTYAGLVGSDTFASIDTPATCGVAGAHTAVGNYTIHCDGSAAADNNYDLSGVAYTDGTLHVVPVAVPGFSVSPASWDYGTVKLLVSVAKVFQVTNTGTADLVITTITRSGTNRGQFLISANTCSGATVPAGQTCSLTVTFKPTLKGSKTASIVFADNAGGHTVALSGKGGIEQLLNGGFNAYPSGTAKIPTNWSANGFAVSDGRSTTVKKEGTASIKIRNTAAVSKTLTQVRAITGGAGINFQLSVWLKGLSVPTTAGAAKVEVKLYNGSTLVQPAKVIVIPNGTYSWRRKIVSLTSAGAFNKVVVTLTYAKGTGTVYFDRISLLRSN